MREKQYSNRKTRRARPTFGRFSKNREGATAIEFAILAMPFLLVTFAVIETSISFTAQQLMSNTVDQLSRQIRTGQIVPSSTSEAEFRKKICDDLTILFASNCPELEFDLKSYSNFSDVPTAIPMASPTSISTAGFTYSPGGAETINHLRVFYRWPIITDFMKLHLAGLDDGKTLLYSSATWQNEPF